MEWKNVNLRARTFTVFDTKNRDPLALPLSNYLLKVLQGRRKATSGNGRVFPMEEPRRFVERVREASGVRFSIHDLRRSFATYAEALDLGQYTLKALLNHRTDAGGDVTAGYIQIGTERLREPMQRITDYVLGYGGLSENNVVDLKQQA